jgi:glycopeptide antibiotics resistance protein
MIIYFFPTTFTIGILFLLAALCWLRRKKYSFLYLVVFTLFWLYCMIIIREALFPIVIFQPDGSSSWQQFINVFAHINWVPFSYGPYARGSAIFWEVFLNFLITIPVGLVLPYLIKLGKRGIWIALVISGLGIEFLQLTLSLFVKFPYRVVDISDVILNTAGFLVGYFLFRLFSLIKSKIN